MEEPQPSFGLPNPPSEVEPRGLPTAPPTQGAEESQPTFGLPSPPSEVEPRSLQTAPPPDQMQKFGKAPYGLGIR